jgi:acetyl-CoA C-acetyltransferase/acetyl-CoA acyltransferase
MPSDAANPARVAALRAGIPAQVPAFTVQRNCASGMEAVMQAASLVELGVADVVLCGGMESMSNYAAELPRSYRRKMGAVARARTTTARLAAIARLRPRDFKAEWGILKGLTDPTCGLNMGQTAEVLARELSITRAEQDAFALRSHQRAAQARERLAEEIVPVPLPGKAESLLADDNVRGDQSLEKLAKLRPAFARDHGTVTPGNACGITDGACALIVVSAAYAEAWGKRRGAQPLGRIAAWGVAGVAPERMGLGPVAALPRALQAAGWSLEDLGLLEINEAFAVQVIACLRVMESEALMKEHAGWDRALGRVDDARLNVNGGAIALGHPVGVSGARLVLTLGLQMRRAGARRAGATLCVGGGQGAAILMEAP